MSYPQKVSGGFELLIVSAFVILVAMFILNILSITAEKTTNLALSGSPTSSIFDGRLIFNVGNSDHDTNKSMRIYALANTPILKISASHFFDNNSGKSIQATSMRFNNVPQTIMLTNIIQQVPQVLSVSIDNIDSTQPGIYYGSIFVDAGNKTSIPLTVDIKPNLGEVIIIVVDGILLSILAWKVIIYSGHKHLNIKLTQAAKNFQLDPNDTPFQRLQQIAGEANLGISFEQYVKNQATYDVTHKLSLSRYVHDIGTPQKALNETMQTIGTILFGIGVSGLGLFNNGYITSLHNIGIQEVAVLLGIGLGIGSLKDFVDKFNSKSP
jgi:hypothetical protein